MKQVAAGAHRAGGLMQVTGVIPQLRTTDLAGSIRFYTTMLGEHFDL